MAISQEAFEEMIRRMDKDGDGDVDRDEYKIVYLEMFPDTDDEAFQAVWDKIDADGDGNLTVKELAMHYGFDVDAIAGSANEMTDEQILEALQLGAMLAEKEMAANERPDAKPKEKVAAPPPVTVGARDPTLKVFRLTASDNKPDADFTQAQIDDVIKLDQALQLSELRGNEDKDDVESMLTKSPPALVRVTEHTTGEMPLHRLCRFKVTDDNRLLYKDTFNLLIERSREECKRAGTKLAADVNYQCKQGKTPLFLAVEQKNVKMIELLFSLNTAESKDGPDTLLVNQNGWTVAHIAAHASDLATMKYLFSKISPVRKKVLLSTPDKQGREPLHIASFRDESDDSKIVAFLLQNGAKNSKKDDAGNTPSVLADRSGRRNSKELIEHETGSASPERRKSREEAE